MATRTGRYTLHFENHPCITAFAAIAGKKEAEGPLGECFDKTHLDTTLGQDSWEKAEAQLQKEAVELALQKADLPSKSIDYILAGDLLNQCISSTFGLRSLDIPFIGQYGACSTMAQTLGMASLLVDTGAAERTVAVTSSHFCSAERQFRLPLEYGGQRTPTAQWTATASGSIVVSKKGDIHVEDVIFGRIADLGVKDVANMGAAMAPAAVQTLIDYLKDTKTKPEDYDLILTGDLGRVGCELMEEMLEKEGISIHNNHNDCGLLLYDIERQDVHCGGSGCGCSASVLCGYILPKLQKHELHNVLFMATGALLSTTSSQQGESIPGIAHLVHLVS